MSMFAADNVHPSTLGHEAIADMLFAALTGSFPGPPTAPAFLLEIGYGSTWQTEPDDITWVDETTSVSNREHIRTKRGGTNISADPVTGEASWSLKNSDRRFDPFHATSPLVGMLLPGTPFRISAVVGGDEGETIPVITGTVPAWPQRYEKGNTVGWVPIQAFENLDKLARAKIARAVLLAELLADSAGAVWLLDETSGSVMVDASGNGRDGSYVTGTTTLAGTVMDHAPGLILDGSHWGFEGGAWGVNMTMEALVDLTQASDLTDGEQLTIVEVGNGDFRGSGTGYGHQWGVEIVSTDDHTARCFHRTNSLITGGFGYSETFRYDQPRHLAIQVSASLLIGAVRDHYIDGVLTNGSTDPSAISGVFNGLSVGRTKANGGNWRGGLSTVALLSVDLTASRIAAHAAAALAPLDNQTADERIAWVLDELDWPTNLRDLEPGNTILGPATFKPGDGALSYFNLVVKTEDGKLFSRPDGTLRLLDRYWRYFATEATVSQFTFTDAPDGTTYAAFDLDPPNDELLINTARYTRRDGTQQEATDEVSRAAYGEVEDVADNLLHRTDVETRALAQWKVTTSSEPQPSIRKLRVALHTYSLEDQLAFLALDVGYRITAVRTPQGIGDPIELDFVVAGVDHDIGFNEWWTELYVSSVPESTATLFILGTSELGGVDVLAY